MCGCLYDLLLGRPLSRAVRLPGECCVCSLLNAEAGEMSRALSSPIGQKLFTRSSWTSLATRLDHGA